MKVNKPILLIEDNKVDISLVESAFDEININAQLIVARNGEEALNILRDEHQELPSLILLDLSMPKMNGYEFLQLIKQDDQLKLIPILVWTTSSDEQDVVECFKLGVAGYMVKPFDYDQLIESIRIINSYWSLSQLPMN